MEAERWFAWYPVRLHTTGKWAWMRFVNVIWRDNGYRCSETHRSWKEYY